MVEVAAASGQLIRIHHAHRAESSSGGSGEGSRTQDGGQASPARAVIATQRGGRGGSDRTGLEQERAFEKATRKPSMFINLKSVITLGHVAGSLVLWIFGAQLLQLYHLTGFLHPSWPFPFPDRTLPDR